MLSEPLIPPCKSLCYLIYSCEAVRPWVQMVLTVPQSPSRPLWKVLIPIFTLSVIPTSCVPADADGLQRPPSDSS